MYLRTALLQCKEVRKKHQKVKGDVKYYGSSKIDKEKIRKTQMTKIRNERGGITVKG